MPDASQLSSSTVTTRRTVLRATGFVALGGGGLATLAACPSGTGTTAPSTPAPATSAPATSPPAASASATPSPSASPAASRSPKRPSGPSVAAADVPVGGGVILQDADYVITQPTAGKFKAFSKICTHMHCLVTSVEGGTINCPCHGSKFSVKDGSVVSSPATSPLPEAKVTVASGRVVVDK